MSAPVYDFALFDDLDAPIRTFQLPYIVTRFDRAPLVTDDDSAGFVAGSFVVDRTTDKIYDCKDNATGAAVWAERGSGSGSSPLTTKGDLYGFSTVDARIPVGADGKVLTADSGAALGVSWLTPIVYDALGAAAAAQAASQPLDADLTAIAALATTSFGRGGLTQASDAAFRTYIGAGTGSGDALVANPLSQFAATTSAQLAGVLSDETGTGLVVFSNGPTFIAPILGTPASGVATNLTGTASGLTAGNVTTNANLTGPITSAGNATSIAAQTGTGTTFAMSASPALTGAPTAPTAAGGTNTTQIATTAFVTAAISGAVSGMTFKGSTDCSANPNYPAGVVGDLYMVSVAGKIGGASGTVVDVGDWYLCEIANAGGTEASVGADWGHMEHNLVGALLATNNLSDVANAATAVNNLGGAASTGSGGLVRITSPALVTPLLGTPTSGVLTNCTGTASGLTAGNVTTNANLTGPITSVGNATSVASQTGTGTKFVMDTAPTIVGGLHTAITSLGIRSTGAAFDLTLASAEVLTAGRTLTVSMGDAARTLTFTANATIGGTSSGTNTGDQTSIVGITGTLAQFNTACTDADFARTDAANTFTGHQTIEGVTSTGATGTGKFVFDTSPTLVTPLLGTPTSGVLTNCTGTASGLTAGNVTNNANLTGPITSVGNATSIAAQTGTGTTFAMSASPTFTGVPAAPTAAGGTNTTQLATTAFVTAAVAAGGGPAGPTGDKGGLRYNFSTSTTDADPGTGVFRYNNATVASVTSIFLNIDDQASNDISDYIDQWDDSTNTAARGYLVIQENNPNSGATTNVFKITGSVTTATNYRKVAVAYVSGSLPANSLPMVIQFSRTGDLGATGPTGATGAPGSVTTVSVVTANGVSGSVANPTSTPAITLALADITPSTVTLTGVATPSAVGGKMVYDTTQNTLLFGSGPTATPINTWLVGSLFTSTASAATTTTAETKSLVGTGIGTMTIPANMAGVGTKLRLTARGAYTTGGTVGTITFQIKIGATVVAATIAAGPTASITNKYWEMTCDIVFRAVGVSGSVMVQGNVLLQPTNATINQYAMRGNSADPPAVVAVNTTGSLLVDFQSITSNANNTVTCNQFGMERLS